MRKSVVPTGLGIYFPLYPALRLRFRAGLNYFALAGLDFRLANSTGKYRVSFSHTLLGHTPQKGNSGISDKMLTSR